MRPCDCRRQRGGNEGDAALRRVGTETQDLQRPALAQFHGIRCVVHSLQRAHRQHGTRTREIDDLLQFVAPVLHRHRTHDDAESQGGEVQRGILSDVGQLRDQDVVTTEAQFKQSQRVAVGEVRDVLERETQWGTADEHVAIRGIEHGELRGSRGRRRVEQVRDARVRPPAQPPVFPNEFFASRAHV